MLGTSILGGLRMFSGYVQGVAASGDETMARELAADLMAEILAEHFEEPTSPPGSFGPDSSESGGSRRDYDDVDDYDGWVGDPPEQRDGTTLGGAEYSGFIRSVQVRNVDVGSLANVVANGSSAAKRIDVTVTRRGKTRFTLTGFRTRHDD